MSQRIDLSYEHLGRKLSIIDSGLYGLPTGYMPGGMYRTI